MVVSTVASHQEGPWFEPSLGQEACLCGLHVLPVTFGFTLVSSYSIGYCDQYYLSLRNVTDFFPLAEPNEDTPFKNKHAGTSHVFIHLEKILTSKAIICHQVKNHC